MARALYCSVDPATYKPLAIEDKWDLGYLGTYSDDRQPALEELLVGPATQWKNGRFIVAGPQYPDTLKWPANVERSIHLSPREHPAFYGAQRFTLNITRAAMKKSGYSPSVRLFEAGACAVPIISDWWEGLDTLFAIGTEVLVAETGEGVLRNLHDLSDERRRSVAAAARQRILSEHTPAIRAAQLLSYLKEMNDNVSPDTSRRNRRHRTNADRMDGRMPSEQKRNGTGNQSCAVSVGAEDARHLHESARKGS
jgi:spore maturation protein CgeB